MADPETTSPDHYVTLVKALQAWIKQLMLDGNFTGAFGLTSELEWLSKRAGIRV